MKIANGYTLPRTYPAAVLNAVNQPLEIEHVPIEPLHNGEVWVHMKAAPINPSDLALMAGRYPIQKEFPFVPGLEGSGVVVASGGGFLANRLVGKRVACSAPDQGNGTWAAFMRVDATRCVQLHKGVDFEQGASSLVNPLTALALLSIVRVRGKAFVNTAAAGALGKMMIKLAKERGLNPINLVRKEAHVNELKALGAEVVLNTTAQGFEAAYKSACAALKPATILDAVGGNYSDTVLAPAPANCLLVAYASLSGEKIKVSPQPILRENKSVVGFHLGTWLKSQSLISKLKLTRQAQKLMANGTFYTTIQERVNLKQLNSAIKNYQSNMSAGKQLVVFE